MSNKVYGFCDAGCRYRVPTFDDFERSAGVIRQQAAKDGKFYLDIGKRYIIKNATESDGWAFGIELEYKVVSNVYRESVELPTYSVLDDCTRIKIICTGIYVAPSQMHFEGCVYINDSGQKWVHLEEADLLEADPAKNPTLTRLIVTGSAEVFLVNEDANTISEGGGDLPAVGSADEGKILRVVNGKWQAVKIASAEGASF
jgi:hypothetical protein